MFNNIKRFHLFALTGLLTAALALSAPQNAFAAQGGWPEGPSVTAKAAILMEAKTGTILYSKNIHQQEYPASCTKILTCLIAADRCGLEEMVYMSKSAIQDTPRDSNHIALDIGEAINMEEALSAILIRSANEVSFAVAEHITGTTWQDFGAIMNEKAAELGCLNSHFVNPNGLPDDNHYTTAYDLAMIARHFFANEFLAKLSRSSRLVIPATETQPDNIIENSKNLLLAGKQYAYEDLIGSKTGYTTVARNCLVSCAERNGLRLICVVLNDDSPAYYEDTTALLDYGFSNFKAVNVNGNETRYHINDTGMFYSDNDIFGNSRPLLTLNAEDFIVLPQTASFEEAIAAISYDSKEKNQAALITYTWNGVSVGSASVDFTDSQRNSYTFDSLMESSKTSEETIEEETSVIFINVMKVLLWILGAVVLLAVILLLFLLFRYLLAVRRSRQKRKRRHSGPDFSIVSHKQARQQKHENLQRRKRIRRRRRQERRFRNHDF